MGAALDSGRRPGSVEALSPAEATAGAGVGGAFRAEKEEAQRPGQALRGPTDRPDRPWPPVGSSRDPDCPRSDMGRLHESGARIVERPEGSEAPLVVPLLDRPRRRRQCGVQRSPCPSGAGDLDDGDCDLHGAGG